MITLLNYVYALCVHEKSETDKQIKSANFPSTFVGELMAKLFFCMGKESNVNPH